jgi:hypothetical protein
MSRGPWRSRAGAAAAAVLLLAGGGTAAAATVDYDVVHSPRSYEVSDKEVELRWDDMFSDNPAWISRQITFISLRVPEKAPTLFAARLLYIGDPWLRRPTDTFNERRWREADLDTRAALLREVRWTRDPAMTEVLEQYLRHESEPGLVRSALVDLYLLSPGVTPAIALSLSDPTRADRLPGASAPAIRQTALSFLIDTVGVDAAESRAALAWALLHATGPERNHGITSLPHGAAPDLLKPAILRLAGELGRGELDDEGRAGLVLCCGRLGADIDPELATALVGIAVNGEREIATAAATALAVNVGWQATVPVDAIEKRAADPHQDPVVRDALFNLLLRLDPAAAEKAAGPNSPWTILAQHRARLRGWDFEKYLK